MYSVILSLVVAALTFAGAFSLFDKWSAILLAPIAGVGVYILLGRRVRKKVEAASKDIEGHIKGQRFEKAIQSLETIRPFYRWQPLLGAATEGQIGMLKYAYLRDFEGARPDLEKAHPWFWQPFAMLAAGHYKKKRYDEMEKVFEKTVSRNKKEALLWAAFAWCQWKRGLTDKALEILGRGRTVLPGDERLKTQQLALQNGKKLKMQGYSAEWLALHLDTPPGAGAAPPGGRRPGYTPPPQAYGRGAIRRGMMSN